MISEEQEFSTYYDKLKTIIPANNYYEVKKIAAYLKKLLIGDKSLINRVNKKAKLKVQFTINDAEGIFPDLPELVFHGDGLDPSVRRTNNIKELELKDFLSAAIFETQELNISVQEIIEFGANKAYGINFDLSKTEKETIIEKIQQELSITCGIDSIKLSLDAIARIVLRPLLPLRKTIQENLRETKITTLNDHKINAIKFSGQGQCLADNLTYDFKHAWGWHGVLRIMPQIGFGEHVFYELGNNNSPPRITLLTDDSGDLFYRFQINEDEIFEVQVCKFQRTVFYDNRIYLALEIVFSADSEIRLSINNKLIACEKISKNTIGKRVSKQTFGSDLNGDSFARFELNEFIIVDKILDGEERKHLANYFDQKWNAYAF